MALTLSPAWTPELVSRPALALGSGLVVTPAGPVPNLLHFWSADDLAPVGDGNTVATWADRVGGLVLSQATAGLRFTYDADGMNGRPAVQGGAGRIMYATLPALAEPATVIVVARTPTATPAATQHLFDGPGAARRDLFYTTGRVFGAQAAATIVAPVAVPGDVETMVGCRFGGTASRVYLDGLIADGSTGAATAPTGISVGGNHTTGTGNWLGRIAAVLVYGRAL